MYQANPTLRSQRIQHPGMQTPIQQPAQQQEAAQGGLGTHRLPEIGNLAAQVADLQARQSSLEAQQAQPSPQGTQQATPASPSPAAQQFSPTPQPSAPTATQQPGSPQQQSPTARQPTGSQPLGQLSGLSDRLRSMMGIPMQGPSQQRASPAPSPMAGQPQAQGTPGMQQSPQAHPQMPQQAQPMMGPQQGQGMAPAPEMGLQASQGPQARKPVTRQPPVDILDEGENLILEIEVPGADKEDIELMGHRNAIQLRAPTRERPEGENVVRSERGQITYERSIPLDVQIDNERIQAKFEDGILRVKAPKRDPDSGPRRIEVD